MGQSLEQLLDGAVNNDVIGFTMTSNQDDGLVLYATGGLTFREGGNPGVDTPATEPRLNGTNDCLFSNRLLDRPVGQRFDVTRSEKLFIDIAALYPAFVHLHFGIGKGLGLLVVTEKKGNLLMGLGPSIGGSTHAGYLFSFHGRTRNTLK